MWGWLNPSGILFRCCKMTLLGGGGSIANRASLFYFLHLKRVVFPNLFLTLSYKQYFYRSINPIYHRYSPCPILFQRPLGIVHKLRNLLGGYPPTVTTTVKWGTPYRNDYSDFFFGRVLFSVTLGGIPPPQRNVVVTVGGGGTPQNVM